MIFTCADCETTCEITDAWQGLQLSNKGWFINDTTLQVLCPKHGFNLVWRVKTRYAERKGTRCRVLIYGKMNNVLVQFVDGFLTITSRNYVRRIKNV